MGLRHRSSTYNNLMSRQCESSLSNRRFTLIGWRNKHIGCKGHNTSFSFAVFSNDCNIEFGPQWQRKQALIIVHIQRLSTSFLDKIPVLSSMVREQILTEAFTCTEPEAADSIEASVKPVAGAWEVLECNRLFSLSTMLPLMLSLASKKPEIYGHHFIYFSKIWGRKLNCNRMCPDQEDPGRWLFFRVNAT